MIEHKELYVTDGKNRNLRIRLMYDDIILIKTSSKNTATVCLASGKEITLNNSLPLLYEFYFKKRPNFIHASEHHIINTSYILSAEGNVYDTELKINLCNNLIARLRKSHPYAYFIMNGVIKKRKSAVTDCEKKDAIIMSSLHYTKDIVAEILRVTGEKISPRYVIKRYKELKINS